MLKKLVFLGTGGTIAGTAAQACDNVGYVAAQVGVADLLQAVPGLPSALGGDVFVAEQVAQVDSKDMGWPQWTALAQRVAELLLQADVRSVIITHGTDTLEETAFFLSQVLSADSLASKPVILTCAMRPASSLTPDGPQNLLDAVAVARCSTACGVLVVCAGTVHGARDVQKCHTYRLNAFDSGDAGPLGYVEEAQVRWAHASPNVDGQQASAIPLERLSRAEWPRVEIIMNYAGATGATVRALCAKPDGAAQPVRGLVVAGTGNGTIHHDLQAALSEVAASGVAVVRASRCAQGRVIADAGSTGFADSKGLSPLKARIALILELMARQP